MGRERRLENFPTEKNFLEESYRRVREETQTLCEPLEIEDFVIQSMDDVSPPKWHLAHTTWFFEEALLKPYLPGYKVFHPQYAFLFNSYYEALGERQPRARRGILSRPTVAEILNYRQYVDRHIAAALASGSLIGATAASRLEIGLHHEQQHQELLLMDVKHILAQNPLKPAYLLAAVATARSSGPVAWVEFEGGVVNLGFSGDGFSYDNERPRHQTLLRPFAVADRLVTNAEFLSFIEDGGYEEPRFWLADGWENVRRHGWTAPLYWEKADGEWHEFTLHGQRPIEPNAPVSHVSFFEADAYARWQGLRLPAEAEWEHAAQSEAVRGNFLETRRFHPSLALEGGKQFFGDLWEWTASPYFAYPGFKPEEGLLAEYNGKFMCNQFVLRGGSCVTPQSHIRLTYRNFFYPHQRWAFGGLRLAKDR